MARKSNNEMTSSTTDSAAQEEVHLASANSVSTMITGYQYGAHGTFISAYQFEKNRDKEEIHCPPCTTLLVPPTDLSVDQEAYFDGEQWQTRRLTLAWLPDRALPSTEEEQHDD